MDDVFSIMLDVTGLVTRGSDRARMEARRIAAVRAREIAPQVQPAAGAEEATVRRSLRLRERLKVGFVPR